MKRDSVDSLIQAAWEFFGVPVLLTDENYKAVCQYPKQKLGQPIWDALLENTALPLEVIQSYNQAYLSDRQPYYRPFYSDQGPSADCPRIYGEVHAGGRIFGYVGIFLFDNPPLPDDLPATQVLLDALTMLLAPRHNREGTSLSMPIFWRASLPRSMKSTPRGSCHARGLSKPTGRCPPADKRDTLSLRLSDFIRDLDGYEKDLLEKVGRTDFADMTTEQMEQAFSEPAAVQQLLDFLTVHSV